MITFDLCTSCVKPFFTHVALDRSIVVFNDLFCIEDICYLMKNHFAFYQVNDMSLRWRGI